MNKQKNDNSEGKKGYSEGKSSHSVITPCTELNGLLFLNCQDLPWSFITPWPFSGRDTQRERGGIQNEVRLCRLTT